MSTTRKIEHEEADITETRTIIDKDDRVVLRVETEMPKENAFNTYKKWKKEINQNQEFLDNIEDFKETKIDQGLQRFRDEISKSRDQISEFDDLGEEEIKQRLYDEWKEERDKAKEFTDKRHENEEEVKKAIEKEISKRVEKAKSSIETYLPEIKLYEDELNFDKAIIELESAGDKGGE